MADPLRSTRDDAWGDCTPEEAVEAVKAVRKSQPASLLTCDGCGETAEVTASDDGRAVFCARCRDAADWWSDCDAYA